MNEISTDAHISMLEKNVRESQESLATAYKRIAELNNEIFMLNMKLMELRYNKVSHQKENIVKSLV